MSTVVLSDKLRQGLAEIFAPEDMLLDLVAMKPWAMDWTKPEKVSPSAVVFPRSTKQVSECLKFCHQHQLAVVPNGGLTGLAGGAIAANGEIVLNFCKMNRIEEIDSLGLTATVEAGVTTQALQMAAKDRGFFFPIDLAAKGSSHVGGNIATNAGGTKFIRFGGMREQVIDLEVVLMDGTILPMCRPVRKNNSGIDLKQLFIGTEGVLGVVTRAIVKLMPPLESLRVGLCAVQSFDLMLLCLEDLFKKGVMPTAFEFFSDEAYQLVAAAKGKKIFSSDACPYYFLVEVPSQDAEKLDAMLEDWFEKNLIVDAVLGGSQEQFREIWSYREDITETLSQYGYVHKNDVSVAVKDLKKFVDQLSLILATEPVKLIRIILFGHIGDGNVHLNYIGKKEASTRDEFIKEAKTVEKKVFHLLKDLRGSISAEHGIGLLKKNDLRFTRTEVEIDLMKKIKAVLDQKNLLNPGKIFD